LNAAQLQSAAYGLDASPLTVERPLYCRISGATRDVHAG